MADALSRPLQGIADAARSSSSKEQRSGSSRPAAQGQSGPRLPSVKDSTSNSSERRRSSRPAAAGNSDSERRQHRQTNDTSGDRIGRRSDRVKEDRGEPASSQSASKPATSQPRALISCCKGETHSHRYGFRYLSLPCSSIYLPLQAGNADRADLRQPCIHAASSRRAHWNTRSPSRTGAQRMISRDSRKIMSGEMLIRAAFSEQKAGAAITRRRVDTGETESACDVPGCWRHHCNICERRRAGGDGAAYSAADGRRDRRAACLRR